jgi:hypothetical protein
MGVANDEYKTLRPNREPSQRSTITASCECRWRSGKIEAQERYALGAHEDQPASFSSNHDRPYDLMTTASTDRHLSHSFKLCAREPQSKTSDDLGVEPVASKDGWHTRGVVRMLPQNLIERLGIVPRLPCSSGKDRDNVTLDDSVGERYQLRTHSIANETQILIARVIEHPHAGHLTDCPHLTTPQSKNRVARSWLHCSKPDQPSTTQKIGKHCLGLIIHGVCSGRSLEPGQSRLSSTVFKVAPVIDKDAILGKSDSE